MNSWINIIKNDNSASRFFHYAEKLKDKKNFKWKKVLKSGAKKVGGGALFFIDGPIPIGDIFGAALLTSDFADGVQAAQEITEAMSELETADKDLKKCQQQTQKTTPKKEDGVKVGGKQLPKKKVKCFKKKQDKHDEKEYDTQLKNQQDGLNNMSVDEYLKGREAFDGISCKDGKVGTDGIKNRSKRNTAQAQKDRKKYEEKVLIPKYRASGSKNPVADAAKEMKTLAALHNPDMVAAGKDIITGFTVFPYDLLFIWQL